MFYLIDKQFKETARTFQPLSNPDAQYISNGHLWKSTNRKDWPKQIAFVRELASKLAEGDDSFVFYHIDGDRTWEMSADGTLCDHFEPFRTFITKKIAHLSPLRPNDRNSPDALEQAFNTRLFLIVPFYSIESWVYQNTTMGRELCRKHYQSRDSEKFEHWERNPALLDEEIRPKEQVCFGSKHNRLLAEQGFPSDKLYGANKSFAKVVNMLLMSPSITRTLDRQRAREDENPS